MDCTTFDARPYCRTVEGYTLPFRGHVSQYGCHNESELFAEGFTAYIHEPAELRRINDGMYQVMDGMLRDRGTIE